MRFVFAIKTKNGGVVSNLHVDARDQKAAEEKIKKDYPGCAITKIEKR